MKLFGAPESQGPILSLSLSFVHTCFVLLFSLARPKH